MSDLQLVLEEMIDKYGLSQVLEWLSQICMEKSVHIQENWQDMGLAKWWMYRGTKLQEVSTWVCLSLMQMDGTSQIYPENDLKVPSYQEDW